MSYEPNEAQLRNLMRYSGVRMAEAAAALQRCDGDWDDAVTYLEQARRRTPRRRHTQPVLEIPRR